jgi:hypothetical protein
LPSTYDPIYTTTLTTAQASIDFTSIPATYTDLVLVVTGRCDSANVSREIRVRFNGDSSGTYSITRMVALIGNTLFTDRTINANDLSMGVFPSGNQGNTADKGSAIWHINDYANTSKNKSILGRTNDPLDWITAVTGLWRSTVAINQVTVFFTTSNFIAGSTATLYGIKAK